MPTIAVIATPQSYVASMGAMIDAHSRVGDVFETNAALSDYAEMETRLLLASTGGGEVELCGGRRIAADCRYTEMGDPRIIFLPSFRFGSEESLDNLIAAHLPFYAWLADKVAHGSHVAACGASVIHLAASGVLDGHYCAVRTPLRAQLKRHFPNILSDDVHRIAVSGTLMTCSRDAEVPSMVARCLGEAFSQSLARGLVEREPPGGGRSGGEGISAGIGTEIVAGSRDPLVAQAQLWIRDRFTRTFRIADLSRDLGVSHQSLIRRFREASGMLPRAFVQRTRVDAASLMLAETNRSISEIAQLVGYADVPSFRRIFTLETGVSPSAWRRQDKARRSRD